MRRQFTEETANTALSSILGADLEPKLSYSVEGPFWDLLAELDLSLAVSREYEHFIVLLGGDGGRPWQTALMLPHPSGLFFDEFGGELIVSSTRTPNQIFWFKRCAGDDIQREIVPSDFQAPHGTLFLPYRSVLLPGSLYIHDIALLNGALHVTATGHNFLARIGERGGWDRVWWPRCVDGLGRASFDQNYLQLNSIAVGSDIDDCAFTAFSDETGDVKPWKSGYGPRGRGVVFLGDTRDVACRGLTCPHAAKWRESTLWLCNSGYGLIGYVDDLRGAGTFREVARLPGFTRGMAFHHQYAFVGLSKVIDFYEPYAPGVTPSESVCGVAIVDLDTATKVAQLTWDEGYQIYDVQLLPGVRRPLLPSTKREADGINAALRFLG